MYQKQFGQNNISIESLDIAITKSESEEYVIFPTPDKNNTAIIGVDEGEYQIQLDNKAGCRIAIAVYIDSNSLKQKITPTPKDPKKVDYSEHNNCRLIITGGRCSVGNWVSEKAPKLTFTLEENKQVATYLGGSKGIITVYAWSEGVAVVDEYEDNSRGVGTGVGQDTHKQLQKTSGLKNPIFLGVTRIYYTDVKSVKHLGKNTVSAIDNVSNDVLSMIPKS